MIETLEGVEKDRKCFRMVGGVLVERKVGEVQPALVSNRDKVWLNKFAIYNILILLTELYCILYVLTGLYFLSLLDG